MLSQVIADLRFFLIMYAVNIVIFSLVVSVLQNTPSANYLHLGLFFGGIVDTFRMSLGDFEIIARVHDTTDHYILFWVSWSIIVLVLSIIFLNFIVAEASASYEKVTEFLDEVIEIDKCNMQSDAEKLSPQYL
jgi:hypothetical protein